MKFGSIIFILPLILRRVPSDELGLWYIFGSLSGFASLLDFGFAPTVTRSVAYLWAGASKVTPYGLEVEPERPAEALPNLPLLANLVTSLRVYYFGVGLLALALMLGGGGGWIWYKTQSLPNASSLRLAWVVCALGAFLTFVNSLWPCLLVGVNRVRQSSQIGIACQLCFYGVAVAGLLAGWRLWALVLASVATGVSERLLGRWAFRRTVRLDPGRFDSGMLRALWPNAWRAGLVGLGAFLTVQANTLVCSAFLDLKTTASYGLSFQAVMMLVGISGVWVHVKMPVINHLRTQGKLVEIAELFTRRMRLMLLTYGAGAAGLLCLGGPLLVALRTQTRLLPPALLAALLVVQFLEFHASLYGWLVLSENKNPFLVPSLATGVGIVALSTCLTPRFGLWGMLLSAGIVQVGFNNWWPVTRGIRGLCLSPGAYWKLFFCGASFGGGDRPSLPTPHVRVTDL